MRPGWGKEEKQAAIDMYGGTQAPDYRRNILGEAGGGSSAFFVTARLMACLDQDKESHYNTAALAAAEVLRRGDRQDAGRAAARATQPR
jgi:hypothetical protein